MATIEGTVADSDGNGIEDALVTISDSANDTVEAETRTDASGAYSVTVEDDTHDVRAERVGYEAAEQTNVNVGTGETVTVDLTLPALQPKVIGRRDDVGLGVLAETTAGSGMPVGVQAAVDSVEGYGLYTPDDAWIEGAIESVGGHTLTVDRNRSLRLEPPGTETNTSGIEYTIAGAVVGGYDGNTANGVLGATIAGGGATETNDEFDNVLTSPNEVTDRYGTVGGGAANQAGDAQSSTTGAKYATIGGGWNNTASDRYATVGGGKGNTANGVGGAVGGGRNNFATSLGSIGGGQYNTASTFATVGGGRDNDANFSDATVGGGRDNTADWQEATVGGGRSNTASGLRSTVGGGVNNEATGDFATVAGGGGNTASLIDATVAGGSSNTASDWGSTVGGGEGNVAHGPDSTIGGGSGNRTGKSGTSKGDYATVPGGAKNVAEGAYGFAAGHGAKAATDGSFVWADSTSGSVTATSSNQFIVHASNNVGIGTERPEAPLALRSENNWDLDSGEGDLKIGDNGYRFTLGVATGGGGAGEVNIRAKGGDKELNFGSGGSDILTVQEPDGVYPYSDDTYSLGKDGNRWTEVWATNGTIQTSDARLKTNVADLEDSLERVTDLRPVTYEWDREAGATDGADPTGDQSDRDTHLGLIAQEVADVVPEAITDPGADGYLGLNYGTLVPLLVDAVQDQQERIDDLAGDRDGQRAQIAELEAENEQLRDRLAELEAHVGLASEGPAAADDD